jgi:hypothetical protein
MDANLTPTVVFPDRHVRPAPLTWWFPVHSIDDSCVPIPGISENPDFVTTICYSQKIFPDISILSASLTLQSFKPKNPITRRQSGLHRLLAWNTSPE